MRTVPRAPGAEKILWMFWDRGERDAPEVVKLCVRSWRALNPTWDVRVLDDSSALRYLDGADALGPQHQALPVQQRSVILRLALLSRYGDAWADATVYCVQPLDAWLPAHLETGFFALRAPGPDRLLSNWFLAARAGNHLITQLHRVTRRYFDENRFPRQDSWLRRRLIRRLGRDFNVSVHSARRWLSWPVRRVLRVYPYFVSHYLFDQLLHDDAECRALWQAGKPLSAATCHLLQDYGDLDLTAKAIASIDQRVSPVFKLSWRSDITTPYWREVLEHLRSILPDQRLKVTTT